MRKTLIYRLRLAGARHPAAKRWLVLTLCACAVIRLMAVCGADLALESALRRCVVTSGGAERLLGLARWPSDAPGAPGIPGLVYTGGGAPAQAPEEPAVSPDPGGGTPDAPPAGDAPGAGDPGGDAPPQTPDIPPAAPPDGVYSLFDRELLDGSGILLSNRTDYEIDIGALLNEPLCFSARSGEPTVLIVHTHGSEAYTAADGDDYEESEGWRTTDTQYNVVRVGDELAALLDGYGIGVVHDRSLHDYPAYTGAYSRSLASIERHLAEYPGIKLVIDLHRDAIMDDNGAVYKTVAQIGDSICSQILLIAGTNFSGLDHPYWEENLKLALRLQYAMNELYPSLAKPIQISQYRYNQHMTTGSLIVEVGCNGNTLRESLEAAGYFADAAAAVIHSVTEPAESETPPENG